jgi:iron complex transport system substrate-binding protein
MRIVSLLPSATEIVCALGAESELVGRSEECDYPPSVRRLPVVMRARDLDAGRTSQEIDDRVHRMLSAGESLYELDLVRLSGLRPDLVLTQDLCKVCSVTEDEVRSACRRLGRPPEILSLSPRRWSEIWASVLSIGRAVGRASEADALARKFLDRTAPRVTPSGPPMGIAVVEWLDPPILAGLWTPEMIELAGGRAIGPSPGSPGVKTSWSHIARDRPDLLVVSPCSFAVERTRREIARGGLGRPISEIAPRLGVYLADEAYFSRPGPRLGHGVELLRDLLEHRGPRAPMPVERYEPSAPEVAR